MFILPLGIMCVSVGGLIQHPTAEHGKGSLQFAANGKQIDSVI